MYLYGSFENQRRETISVYIVTGGSRSGAIEIGADSSDIFFSDNPVEINSEVNDTFDHLLRSSAVIRLQTRNYIPDLFGTTARATVVNIYKGGECLFAGFVEPQTYSQPYNEVYDELSLNCIDALSALQYSKYKNIGSTGVIYSVVKANASQQVFLDIMTEIFNGITSDIDILGNGGVRYLFDGSKAVDSSSGHRYSIFSQLSISELLFLGDTDADVWDQSEVIEEIMRYLNLHIVQDGLTFYIFSWESIKAGGAISWQGITDGQVVATSSNSVSFSMDNVCDCDTQISIGEVYNQILLTCSIESVDNVIESPLSDSALSSPFTYWQKYCTEYSSDGEGKTALNAFWAMTHNENTDYGEGCITNWFLQVMSNSEWIFPRFGVESEDLIDLYCSSGKDQQTLPNWLASNPGAAILSLGSVDINTAHDDNSPVSKVNMTNCLVLSVNGNGRDEENYYFPNADNIKASIPYAVYNGNISGGNFSPADDSTTNYIVISGKVVMNPLMEMSATYSRLQEPDSAPDLVLLKSTVPSRNNKDGRFYTRQYWKATNPSDDAVWDKNTDYGFIPFSDKGPQLYEFKYSAIGEGSDTISKVAVLACMLIIGDKCVVETGTNGQVTDFEWRTYKPLSQCSSEDEYYQQSFTIGFDPKIGDKLIGTEFSMQNNISYTMGIDAEGIAIPIKKSDHINGQVKFMILGPVNTIWDEITRRHGTFFRHTSWKTNSVPLLAHVSSIIVKSFEVKVYSDNGLVSNIGDNDLIYMSDTNETFVNKKDDLEFRINSDLTAAECQSLGVANSVKLSTPVNVSTNESLLTIHDYNHNETDKPEKLYVNSYYEEYHEPKVIMDQSIMDVEENVSRFNLYSHPAIGKSFFVQGISRNLIEGNARLNLKEL